MVVVVVGWWVGFSYCTSVQVVSAFGAAAPYLHRVQLVNSCKLTTARSLSPMHMGPNPFCQSSVRSTCRGETIQLCHCMPLYAVSPCSPVPVTRHRPFAP